MFGIHLITYSRDLLRNEAKNSTSHDLPRIANTHSSSSSSISRVFAGYGGFVMACHLADCSEVNFS
jgi:hypothetical protein